ncbi:F-actin-uncapping protein LRRC16A isoform X3 [Octopus bimaculoides]|uniref:F-actin-uncapping protein LRRC16A isoform X3 n=1 Tax=Octopus bimaculoides TaxID=37653 RepID=UPI0022E9189E|nr:F-actin-uncapping protein LRRC16A isoform X3 [Octopus bimaculoides]
MWLLEHSFHYLDIQSIESPNPNRLSLIVDGKQFNFVPLELDSDKFNYLITHIGVSLQSVFPGVPLERLIKKIDVIPPERLNLMHNMIKDKAKKDPGPCGGFSHMYASMCDYHHLPYRDEVAWDVDTIYLTHDTKELRLKDFDHLENRDLLPIISSLENNSWFTGINAKNVRLTSDVASEIVKVFKKNSVLEELSLSNTGIKSDLIQKLTVALLSNKSTQLAKVDLSVNVLDDRGIVHFLGFLSKLNHGLSYLDLSKTGLTGKGINKLSETMTESSVIQKSLKTLKIADNPMKGEDMTNLCKFLATSNVLTHLDLSGLEIPLEMLSGALVRGCVHHMNHLNLSRNPFSLRKTKEATVPQSWKQLFSSFFQLFHLDLSNCKLPIEAVRLLLLGISSNINVNQLHLDLSGNELRFSPPYEIDVIIGHMTNLISLDISNNRFDLNIERIFKSLCNNRTLKHLSVGRNFSGVKAKYLPRVLDSLVQLLHDENCCIESLSLADSKLKGDTTLVINALGSNSTLKELDISGNSMEDVGARMLAKALQINNKLQTIIWDRNGTTIQGFQDIADALEENYVLKKMPTPVFDATVAIKYHPEKVEAALQKMVDRLVVQVQDTVNAISRTSTSGSSDPSIEQAGKFVNDANNSQQLLPLFQKIAFKSQDIGNPVEKKLKSIVLELEDVLASHIQNTVQEMLDCAKTQCSTVLHNEEFYSDLKNSIGEKQKLPKDLVLQSLTDVSTDIFNKLSEMNLLIAAHMSDQILEEVIESLSKSHKKLSNKLVIKKRSQSNGSLMDGENIEKEHADDAASGQLSENPTDENKKHSPAVKYSSSYKPIEMLQDLSDLDYSPKLNYKKKSLYGRKLRPQSVIDHEAVQQALKMHAEKSAVHTYDEQEEVIEESTDATEESGIGSNVTGIHRVMVGSSQLMNHNMISSGSEISLSSLLSMAGSSQKHPDLGPNRMTKSAIDTFDTLESLEDLKSNRNQSLDSLNFDSMTSLASLASTSSIEIDISPTQKLQHINKARPKRKKNHAITKPQTKIINEVVDINADEGLSNFFNNLRSMKETVSTPEDIGQLPKDKHQIDVNRYSSLSETDGPLIDKNDKTEVSVKHEAKPEVKKKNWNPFDKISNPFSKKHKPDNPKHKLVEGDIVKDIKDDPKVSTGFHEITETTETPHETCEKLKRSPVVRKINVNMLAEMKKKQDMHSSQKDLTLSTSKSTDHDNSQKAGLENPDVNVCLRSDLSCKNLNSKPFATPQQKIVMDTQITCENASCKENKSPLQSPNSRALPGLNNIKSLPKPTETNTINEASKKSLEKDAVGLKETIASAEISLHEEVTPIYTKNTVVTEIRNKNSCIKDCLNEKTLGQNLYKADNKAGNLHQDSLGSKTATSEEPNMKPKPAPRTSFTSTKPAIKSKPPPPVAPKPSVPSRPSLKRTTVHRNSVESLKEVSTKENSYNNDNVVVYDSATLRLSVQEKVSKISNISQLMEKSVIEDNTDCNDCDAFSNKKRSSFPCDTQISKELKDHEADVLSRPNSMLCEKSSSSQSTSKKPTTLALSSENKNKQQPVFCNVDEKVDISPTSTLQSRLHSDSMLNISTEGLDTSRLSMCSSHHSSAEEAESDAEIIFL